MKVSILRWNGSENIEAEVIEAEYIQVWQRPCHYGPSVGQVYIVIRGRASVISVITWGMQVFLSTATHYKVIRHAADLALIAKGGAA